jgi:hypothetical protein
MDMTFVAHLSAVLLAAFALWSIRHELSERARGRLDWAIAPVLAVAAAGVLLKVSPGQRFELWAVCIGGGLAIGGLAGMGQKVIADFARKLVLVHRTWDGVGAAALLFVLALTRLVTSDLMHRPSHGFGVLGGLSVFLACYLAGRAITIHLYTARKSIHLDMVPGERRRRGE